MLALVVRSAYVATVCEELPARRVAQMAHCGKRAAKTDLHAVAGAAGNGLMNLNETPPAPRTWQTARRSPTPSIVSCPLRPWLHGRSLADNLLNHS